MISYCIILCYIRLYVILLYYYYIICVRHFSGGNSANPRARFRVMATALSIRRRPEVWSPDDIWESFGTSRGAFWCSSELLRQMRHQQVNFLLVRCFRCRNGWSFDDLDSAEIWLAQPDMSINTSVTIVSVLAEYKFERRPLRPRHPKTP